jgi:dipeptidyl-peptidase 4
MMRSAPALRSAVLLAVLATTIAAPAAGRQVPDGGFPAERYERAARVASWNVESLVRRGEVQPQWLPDGRFWYRNRIADGHEFIVVDPARGTRARAFDHERMAALLSEAGGQQYTAWALPLTALRPLGDGRGLGFELDRRRWECDVVAYLCPRPATPVEALADASVSPDGRHAVLLRNHNLWLREIATGQERQVTTDGVARYGYATDNEGWRESTRPAVRWSPDGRRVLTYRLDERDVRLMHLLETAEPAPVLHSWPYALPGDTAVPLYERVVIDVAAGTVVPLDVQRDHQRMSSCCGMLRGDAWGDAEWSADGRHIAFTSVSRDYRDVVLRIADAATGQVRTILEERGEPFFEATAAGRGIPNWRVLHGRGQVLWLSHRDNNAHLWLHDLATGREVRRLTSGDWNVIDVMHVDEAGGWLYFTAAGREAGRDPYFRHLYRIRLDGRNLTLLTPEDADHVITMSPNGAYFVDSHSTVARPPVSVLRRADGRSVRVLEEADIGALQAAGWVAPIPFTALARDGVTEIHGVMYRPSDFDESRRYPIINNIYPGPQAGSIGPRTFAASRRGNVQALAELGFIVVQVDALGTPMRGRDIHAYYAGDLADNGLPDQIAAMRQLAERYPWIDLGRVGIYGHSGGGFAAAAALLRHAEFFHVGVASAGNMDNRAYTYYWGEKWQGPLVPLAGGGDTYSNQALHLFAENLRGRLLIAYGTMDSNVPPNSTLLLINELIRHNRDFDTIVMPNRNHGFANEPYFVRRTWDYFVTHLLGAVPPREFRLGR